MGELEVTISLLPIYASAFGSLAQLINFCTHERLRSRYGGSPDEIRDSKQHAYYS